MPPPSAAKQPPIEILSATPGHSRLRVRGLYHNPACKRRLETWLGRRPEIRGVRASTLTGAVRLQHDRQPIERLRALVQQANAGAAPAASDDGEPAPVPGAAPPWHELSTRSTLRRLGSRPGSGLSAAEVRQRRARHGVNRLPQAAARSSWSILREQFINLPVALLTASAGFSLLTRARIDAAAILGVVGLNGLIGFRTEQRAEQIISGLAEETPQPVLVRRERRRRRLAQDELVPGDILLLTPGDYVAADARLLLGHHLRVDESALTGEGLPVAKRAADSLAAGTPLAERGNMVFMGTRVTGGSGVALVVGTGRATELGRIQALAEAAQAPQTPLQRELNRMSSRLAVLGGAVGAVSLLLSLLRGQGTLPVLRSSITLAVAAIPEGLPTVATSALALGIRRLRRHRAAVRRLPAVESLGAVTALCLDKTGTLTANRMSVAAIVGDRAWQADEGDLAERLQALDQTHDAATLRLLQIGALCNDSVPSAADDWRQPRGSATENALLEAALDAGIDIDALRRRLVRGATRYRTEQSPYMATLHRRPEGGSLVAVKGSPAAVLEHCRWRQHGDQRLELDGAGRDEILAANQRLAAAALRVLGLAYAEAGDDDSVDQPPPLTWLGLVGMTDPIRPEVGSLIDRFHHAGIKTIMITGDQRATAAAIGRKLRLADSAELETLDSARLGELSPQRLEQLVGQVDVFARVSPADKLHIVRALQEAGEVVAMTGDGINDGPALKAADIGIAMGRSGTEAARATADVVIEDDNLHTILTAVEGGRTIYSNIRKAVRFLLSTNLSEIQLMLGGIALNVGQPLTPMQLLWINLITDIFPGLALAVEPPEADLLQQPPRAPGTPIVTRPDLLRMGRESALLAGTSLAAYLVGRQRHGVGPTARSSAFMTLTVGQLLHAYSCRSETVSMFSRARPPNRYLDLAVGGSLALQVLGPLFPPLRRLLGVTRLGSLDALLTALLAVAPLLINEALKGSGPAAHPERRQPGSQQTGGQNAAAIAGSR